MAIPKTDKSFIAVLGPFKIECVLFEDAVDGSTFASKLADPQFAAAFDLGDASGASDVSAGVSGKTVTIHDPAGTNVMVFVFGDNVWGNTSEIA
jgi:hypothetical protein